MICPYWSRSRSAALKGCIRRTNLLHTDVNSLFDYNRLVQKSTYGLKTKWAIYAAHAFNLSVRSFSFKLYDTSRNAYILRRKRKMPMFVLGASLE